MHGDDDQIVPIADSALLSAKLVRNGTLKVYPGYPHVLADRAHVLAGTVSGPYYGSIAVDPHLLLHGWSRRRLQGHRRLAGQP